jgi:hypothetical protein
LEKEHPRADASQIAKASGLTWCQPGQVMRVPACKQEKRMAPVIIKPLMKAKREG